MRLDLSGVEKWFDSQAALRGVTESIADFQALAIIGPSGGGKTTLLRLIAGLEIPDRGTLAIDGEAAAFHPGGPAATPAGDRHGLSGLQSLSPPDGTG